MDTERKLIRGLAALEGETQVIVVDNGESLEHCSSVLSQAAVLGWDTEAPPSTQIKQVFLLDVSPGKWQVKILSFVRDLLENPLILKVIHDPRADADALLHLCGIKVVNVHDTQIRTGGQEQKEIHGRHSSFKTPEVLAHMSLRPGAINPGLNTSLSAFGCPINDARDPNMYKINPSFWRTRPLTHQMRMWASSDVNLLFVLYMKQISDARWPLVEVTVQAASKARLDELRNATLVKVHSSQIGRFIGKNGANIKRLRGKFPSAQFEELGRRTGSTSV
eukprot:g19461.t1